MHLIQVLYGGLKTLGGVLGSLQLSKMSQQRSEQAREFQPPSGAS